MEEDKTVKPSEEEKAEKPSAGAWDTLEQYPEKVVFTPNIPVKVKFADDFDKPLELPSRDNLPDNSINEVFYIFNCLIENKPRAIMTSAWTLLKALKGHMPLAKKELIITKKLVGARQMFYVEIPGSFGTETIKEVTITDSGIAADGTI